MKSDKPSRIPVRIKMDLNHTRTTSAPSKLQRLAEEFQLKILVEKQEKIAAIYQNYTNQTLQRVQGYQQEARNPAFRSYGSAGTVGTNNAARNTENNGMLRDFFKERRELQNNPNANRAYHSNIKVHYQQRRANHDNTVGTPSGSQYNGSAGTRPPLPKNRVGRDKAHPLEPLQRQPNGSPATENSNAYHSPKPPPFEKKPKMVRQFQQRRGSQGGFTSGSEREASPSQEVYDNLPSNKALIPVNTKPQKVARVQKPKVTQITPASTAINNGYNGTTSQEDTPPSSGSSGRYRRWKLEQMRAREERQRSGDKHGRQPAVQQPEKVNALDQQNAQPQQKKTDFQKWQQEQDEARTERLRKHAENQHNPDSPDPNNNHRINLTKRTPSPHHALEPISNQSTSRTTSSSRSQKGDAAHSLRQRKLSILNNTRKASVVEDRGNSTDEDESTHALRATIKAKEEALQKMIALQQKELEEIRRKNQREEEEEKIENEKRKKRMAQQKERQRALRAAERVRSQASQAEDEDVFYGNSRQGNHSRNDYRNNHQDSQSRNTYRRDSTSHRLMDSPEPEYKAPVLAKTRKQPKRVQKQQVERQPTPDNENTAFYLEMATTQGALEDVTLIECPTCGRKFAEDRLIKHSKVCRSGSQKTRKVFDPVKMRTEGTEMAQYQGKTASKRPEKKTVSKSNWRTQHEDFIKSIRYAKKVTEVEKKGGNLADLPPPPVSENPDYKQCPYCERRFNPTAAERHIPKCKDIKARPAPLKQRRR